MVSLQRRNATDRKDSLRLLIRPLAILVVVFVATFSFVEVLARVADMRYNYHSVVSQEIDLLYANSQGVGLRNHHLLTYQYLLKSYALAAILYFTVFENCAPLCAYLE